MYGRLQSASIYAIAGRGRFLGGTGGRENEKTYAPGTGYRSATYRAAQDSCGLQRDGKQSGNKTKQSRPGMPWSVVSLACSGDLARACRWRAPCATHTRLTPTPVSLTWHNPLSIAALPQRRSWCRSMPDLSLLHLNTTCVPCASSSALLPASCASLPCVASRLYSSSA